MKIGTNIAILFAFIMSRLLANIYIRYQSTVDLEALNQRQLLISKTDANGNKRKATVYRLPSNPGLETVLHCINVYRQRARDLQYVAVDYFQNFGGLLEGEDFNNYTNARQAPENTIGHFNQCMDCFVCNYCGRDTKEAQYLHFISHPEEYKKPLKASIRIHANRLAQMRTEINSLMPAAEHNISEVQLKRTLLKLCPAAWERDFDVSGNDIAVMTYNELIEFLENMKLHSDREFENTQRRRRDREGGSQNDGNPRQQHRTQYESGGRGRGNSGRGNRGGRGYGNRGGRGNSGRQGGRQGRNDARPEPGMQMCRQHGIHPWKYCPSNWNSPYYDPNYVMPTGGNTNGGRGRGNGGRFPSSGPSGRGGYQ